MDTREQYRRHALYYDAIYHWKRYREEAERVHELLSKEGVRAGAHLVEAGCGTGNFLPELARWYRVSGFDINPQMVTCASEKLDRLDPATAGKVWTADMVDFELDQPCDVIVSLFSSIGYVFPIERLSALAATFHRNLVPGGVILIEPWFTPGTLRLPECSLDTYDSPELKLARACRHHAEGQRSLLDYHWIVLTPEGIESYADRHELWQYTQAEILGCFQQAGFALKWYYDGLMPWRGLVVGVRG